MIYASQTEKRRNSPRRLSLRCERTRDIFPRVFTPALIARRARKLATVKATDGKMNFPRAMANRRRTARVSVAKAELTLSIVWFLRAGRDVQLICDKVNCVLMSGDIHKFAGILNFLYARFIILWKFEVLTVDGYNCNDGSEVIFE